MLTMAKSTSPADRPRALATLADKQASQFGNQFHIPAGQNQANIKSAYTQLADGMAKNTVQMSPADLAKLASDVDKHYHDVDNVKVGDTTHKVDYGDTNIMQFAKEGSTPAPGAGAPVQAAAPPQAQQPQLQQQAQQQQQQQPPQPRPAQPQQPQTLPQQSASSLINKEQLSQTASLLTGYSQTGQDLATGGAPKTAPSSPAAPSQPLIPNSGTLKPANDSLLRKDGIAGGNQPPSPFGTLLGSAMTGRYDANKETFLKESD